MERRTDCGGLTPTDGRNGFCALAACKVLALYALPDARFANLCATAAEFTLKWLGPTQTQNDADEGHGRERDDFASRAAGEEAEARLRQYGPNAVREGKRHPLRAIAHEFWAPVPWMLEVTVVLEVILGKRPEAMIIGILLVFNAGLGFVQENRAQNALAQLRQRLPILARVLRDGQWELLSSEHLVPGDFIHVRTGDIMPADVRLSEGQIQTDQSALTGESLPVDEGPDQTAFAGSTVTHGKPVVK